MNRCYLLIAALLAWVAQAQAQQSPHIGYAFPAGGQQGTQCDVRVGGQYLDGVAKAHISGAGIQVTVVELVKPMTNQQANALRDKLKALLDRLPGGAAAFGKLGGKSAAKSEGKSAGKKGDKAGDKSATPPQNTAPLTAEERR